jgi:hypothetical protein
MENEQAIAAYAETAVEHAAVALLWQASDATEDGNGFPIGEGGNEFADRVVAEVPYLTEAVTAFVTENYDVLTRIAHVTPEQCGHDIILTANRHGAGFWDRGLSMPVDDEEALTAWRTAPRAYAAWLDGHRPAPAQRPQSAGDYLTDATRGYSFEAEFALDGDGDVAWLMVENVVLADELGWASDPAAPDGDPELAAQVADMENDGAGLYAPAS